MNDIDLVTELAVNPNRAMDYIIREYTGLVYSVINSKISSVGTAEDVKECVSDVFMEFYHHVKEMNPEKGSIKGYLAVIAKHRGIDAYRKLSGNSLHLVPMEENEDRWIDRRPNPEQEFIHKEQQNKLLEAIEALGEPDHEIFIRKYYLGQKTKEIAKALSMRDNTVDKKISRGLSKLRVVLGGGIYEGA